MKESTSEPISLLEDDFDELVDLSITVSNEYDDDSEYEHEADAEWKRENIRNILASSVSSIVSRSVCQPLDVIKQRLQRTQIPVARTSSRTLLHVGRLLYVEKGVKGFWKGHGTAQVVSLMQSLTLFWTYENLRVELDFTAGMAPHPVLCNFTAGFVSGAAVVLAIHPLAMANTCKVASRQMRSQFGAVRTVQQLLSTGGCSSLYRGVVPTLVHVSPLYGFKFLFYELICAQCVPENPNGTYEHHELNGYTLATAGALSGVVSNSIVYPLDVIKQRLLVGGLERQQYKFESTCRNIGQCYSAVVRKAGFLALYNGLVPCILRSALYTAMQFSIFDEVRDWALDTI